MRSSVVAAAVVAQIVLLPAPGAVAAERPAVVRHVHTDPAGAIPNVPRPVRAASTGDGVSAAGAAPACSDSHSRGYQLLYVYPSDVTSRLASLQDGFLADAAASQDRVAAESSPSPKRPRFFCGIASVQTGYPSAVYTLDPLPQIMDDLAVAGHDRTDRKYVVWWDGPNHPNACGEGTFSDDDRFSSAQNWNNTGPDYAVVYKPPGGGPTFCGWSTVLHEIGHTLGSIMQSAPHSTPNWHCRDENDIMCYVDGPGVTMISPEPCPGTFVHFDCNGDDYFSAAPAAGSYLTTHWNTYNSSWLEATTLPPPDTAITAGPSGSGNGTSASFSFTSTVAGSTFTCSLDGGAGSACPSPKNYSGLPGGSHTFSVFATASGVSDATPATRTWTVGSAGSGVPDTTLTATPASLTNQTTAVFEFNSSVSGSTFSCTVDGGAPQTCSSPASFSGLADGLHAFAVTASAGGQSDPTPAEHSWTIDTVAPVVTLTAPTVSIQGSRSFRVEWTAVDANAVPTQRILMRSASTAKAFDGWSVWREQSSPGATFTGGAGWTYCFVIEVFDAAGNRAVNVGQKCSAIPLDDRWTPANKFERRTVSGFFDNTGSIAWQSGAIMTLSNIRAREINMRVQMCRACRYIDVYWNGQRIKQMSLYTTDPRMIIVNLANFASLQTGTLQLYVVSPVIVIDSIGVSQY